MIKINLLPVKKAAKKERVMTQLYVGIVIIFLAVGVMGYRWYSLNSYVNYLTKQIDNKQREKEKFTETINAVATLEAQIDLLKKQLESINKLERGRDWFIRVLDKVAKSVPRDQLWVRTVSFVAAKKAKTGPVGKESIVIVGSTYNRDYVALFVGNLSIIPCDDDLPDPNDPTRGDKSEVCKERYLNCPVSMADSSNVNNITSFSACRKFYMDKKTSMESAKADLDSGIRKCVSYVCEEKCLVSSSTAAAPKTAPAAAPAAPAGGAPAAPAGGEAKKAAAPAKAAETKKSGECQACESKAQRGQCNPDSSDCRPGNCKGKAPEEGCVDGQDLKEMDKRHSKLVDDDAKLHKEEYVIYTDINLKYIKQTGEVKGTGVPIYDFEIEIRPTDPH